VFVARGWHLRRVARLVRKPPGAASAPWAGGWRRRRPATLIRIAGSSGVTTQDDMKQLVIDE
jgi:hypothetical protein